MQEGHGDSRGGFPQATWGMVELASPGYFCSFQARRKFLHLNLPIMSGFKSWSCLIPCSPSLLAPPHLMSCGLRDITKSWHLDKILKFVSFQQVFQIFHHLIAQAVLGIYIKSPLALERGYVLPTCFSFEFCMEGACIVNPLIVTKLMALDIEATGLNFWEWDLLQTIT